MSSTITIHYNQQTHKSLGKTIEKNVALVWLVWSAPASLMGWAQQSDEDGGIGKAARLNRDVSACAGRTRGAETSSRRKNPPDRNWGVAGIAKRELNWELRSSRNWSFCRQSRPGAGPTLSRSDEHHRSFWRSPERAWGANGYIGYRDDDTTFFKFF